jgi:rubrerythrin
VKAERSEGIETGVDDVRYDLIVVLQQALEDCHRYQCFARDARATGDTEVADWFDDLAASDREIAGRAQVLLAARS